MKYFLLLTVGFSFSFSNFILAEPNSEIENMVKFQANQFFGSGLHRVLIVPQINMHKGNKVLRGKGVGVIVGEEISEFEDLLSSSLEPVEPLLNSEIYQIYIFYKNNEFKEEKQIMMCEIEGNKVSLISKNGEELIFLRLSNELSKLIISNITKKQF